jgi:hypothetical protein
LNKNIINIIVLAVGVVLIVLGLQEYGTFGSSVSRALGRGPSTRALVLLVCGGVCAALGAMRIFRK